jgi:SnoaL-like domain
MGTTESMRQLLDRMYDSFATGDQTVWTAEVADDVIGFGTDADEWWEGRDAVARIAGSQVKQMSGAGVLLTASDPQIVEHGDTVWSVDRPVLRLRDGTETQLRVTAIAVSDAGSLTLKHFHYSAGAANEEVFQQELTTE